MHIPDGYLGWQTCLLMFLVMIPIWYLAFKKASEKLEAREIPMLAVLSAVSFLVMMFNWPVPDGTTAHMVGGTLIAIILGPYAGVISVSIALLIQALFFGDGGITAFGANSFNMAFVIPFVGYVIYTSLTKVIGKEAKGVVVSSIIASYIAINVAAICAAIEFGVQPIISPGHCPYGLNLAIPAMSFAHLTTAGPVAAAVTAIVIGYLQRTRSDLMKLTRIGPKWLGV